MWQRCVYWLFYLAASAQLHQFVHWFFHHEGFNVSCDKMGTNSIPLMFRCSSSLNLSLSLSPSLVVTHALGMRAGPSFRWHQRAWNSCSSSSSSIRASRSCCEVCNPGSYFQLRRGVRLGGVGHKNKETGEIMKWQEQQVRGAIGSTSFQSYSHSEGVQNMRAAIMFGQTEHVYLDIFHFHWFNLSSLFLTLQ